MACIHLVAQSKGGVGTSFVAAMLAQYQQRPLNQQGPTGRAGARPRPLCIDTDRLHATLAGFQGLGVQCLPLPENGALDARGVATLLEWIASARADVIIDCHARVFGPLLHHLAEHAVPRLLRSLGHSLFIHTVVVGGQAFAETLQGFSQVLDLFPEQVLFVVWLNPFWGEVVHAGTGFEQQPAYTLRQRRVCALVRIPRLAQATDGRALADMLQQRLTFREALAMGSRSILARQRLKIIQDRLFAQLDNARVL